MTTITALLSLAKSAARAAGALVMQKYTQPRELTIKGFRDLATDADYASQKLITNMILAQYPDHAFLAEEEDASLNTNADVIWIIDPIDGTSNYSRQIPNFCVSIAAAVAGTIEAGVIYDPVRDELFSAVRGQGATRNGDPIRPSPVTKLADAVTSNDWSRSPAKRLQIIGALNRLGPLPRTHRSVGSACLCFCWIACGRLDGYFNFQLYLWDAAAGQLICNEAGAFIGGFDGKPFDPSDEDTYRVACTPAIKDEFLAALTATP